MKRVNPRSGPMIDPGFLIRAYRMGMFPMAMEDGEITWFSPDPRGVIPIHDFHIPHGLKKFLKKTTYKVLVNTAFEDVILGCATRKETWIDDVIIRSFSELHRLGWAHSIETWDNGELIGGLYGVAIGGAFFGESMFSLKSEASKVSLVYLIDRLKERGFTLLDTQWTNPHLEQFGAHEIRQLDYLERLEEAIRIDTQFY